MCASRACNTFSSCFLTDKSSDDGGMGLSMIVTIAACGGALVLVAFFIALICLKRRRQRRVRLIRGHVLPIRMYLTFLWVAISNV